jgi:iron(III) transport system permease protein
MDTDTRQALMDFGSRYAVARVLLPKLGPWIAASFFISVALIGNDMVVTNLFQVPTLTESLYQQVQFNEIRIWSVLASCSFVFVLGLVVWSIASKSFAFLSAERSGGDQPAYSHAFAIQGYWRWLGAFVGWLLVCLVVVVPIANLVAKAGWVARAEPQGIQRGWSLFRFAESIMELGSFRTELLWSIQLSLYATGLALALGMSSLCLAKSRWSSSIWIACMAMLLATPGPLINLLLIKISNSLQTDWLVYLADRTLAAPILALQSRCWPLAFGILWVAHRRFDLRHHHQMAIDRGLPVSARLWVRAKAMVLPILTSALVCFFVSFADLSSYLLVLPPGVTTVSMRMFDLLHYGVKNQDASLALGLAVCGMLASVLLFRKAR